jgi:hypothetical protein
MVGEGAIKSLLRVYGLSAKFVGTTEGGPLAKKMKESDGIIVRARFSDDNKFTGARSGRPIRVLQQLTRCGPHAHLNAGCNFAFVESEPSGSLYGSIDAYAEFQLMLDANVFRPRLRTEAVEEYALEGLVL